ncbi:MAG: hypothetical protein CMM50_14025 [Rhodospirillaceae bacterium]|nr:hypothetical protein [Rhodospirillaceae bacterium]
MIVLFTDFGYAGPYVGQMKAVIAREAPGVPVIDLFADAPAFDPMASAYLLAAYWREFPAGTVFLCVVDPGVGGARRPVVLNASERWFVGPDNGLMAIVARRCGVAAATWRRIDWRPAKLSASFHGRDLFAPVAGRLGKGIPPSSSAIDPATVVGADWPDDFLRVVYVDHYGNAMTGCRASALPSGAVLLAAGQRLSRARTFGDVPPGTAFWYENANGLAEIAVNQGRADAVLGLDIGSEVVLEATG